MKSKTLKLLAEILLKYANAATKAAYTQLERAAAPAASFAVKKISSQHLQSLYKW